MHLFPSPTTKLQLLETVAAAAAARQSDTRRPCAELSNSSAPVTFARLIPLSLLSLLLHLPPTLALALLGVFGLLSSRLDSASVATQPGPCSLPTICSKCVEPSVSKTGRPRFPFSLGLVSLFSGASLLPEWLLGLGSGPHQGLLEVAEPGPRLSGPSAAGLRAVHY